MTRKRNLFKELREGLESIKKPTAAQRRLMNCRLHDCEPVDGYCPQCKIEWQKIQLQMKNKREGSDMPRKSDG